jgi:hypothetical protein
MTEALLTVVPPTQDQVVAKKKRGGVSMDWLASNTLDGTKGRWK